MEIFDVVSTRTSPVNLTITIIFLAFIVIIVTRTVRFIFTTSKGIKIGPIDIKKEQDGISNLYYMDCENDSYDMNLSRTLRDKTNSMRGRFMNRFQDWNLCVMTLKCLASACRSPLYHSIDNNHFATELSADNRDIYKAHIIIQIKDEYETIYYGSQRLNCAQEKLEDWEKIKPVIESVIDEWIVMVIKETVKCCRTKIETYKKFLPEFEDDKYRKSIVNKQIEKNEGYITALLS
ncbi:hypothetical protein FACS1894164_11090 [Spirochaetia bacterium]|nr:hypothetical protein FACS1894164_11090 [Spirochaetia bacterium]